MLLNNSGGAVSAKEVKMSEIWIALSAGLGAMVGWGLTDFFSKLALEKRSAPSLFFWLQVAGIPILFLFGRAKLAFGELDWGTMIVLLGMAIMDCSAYILFFYALQKGKLSLVNPIFTAYGLPAVLIAGFFGEQIPPLRWVVMGLIFVGFILVSIDRGGERSGSVLSVAMATVAMLLIGSLLPLWDRFLGAHPDTSVFSWLYVIRVMESLLAFGWLSTTGARAGKPDLSVIVVGLCDVGARIALAWGFAATVSMTGLISLLSSGPPMVAVPLAFLFLGERPAGWQWVGIAAIVGGVLLLAAV